MLVDTDLLKPLNNPAKGGVMKKILIIGLLILIHSLSFAEKPTKIISVLTPNLTDYVFKYEDKKLYWAYENSCKNAKYWVCIDYDGNICDAPTCGCSDFYEKEAVDCDWNNVIPGPLLRELLKK